MLAVDASSQSAVPVVKSPREPTLEMKDLAKRVICALEANGFRTKFPGSTEEGTDFLVRVFCGLEKSHIDKVDSHAANLALYCDMSHKDVTNYVTLAGYKIDWIEGNYLRVIE